MLLLTDIGFFVSGTAGKPQIVELYIFLFILYISPLPGLLLLCHQGKGSVLPAAVCAGTGGFPFHESARKNRKEYGKLSSPVCLFHLPGFGHGRIAVRL